MLSVSYIGGGCSCIGSAWIWADFDAVVVGVFSEEACEALRAFVPDAFDDLFDAFFPVRPFRILGRGGVAARLVAGRHFSVWRLLVLLRCDCSDFGSDDGAVCPRDVGLQPITLLCV